MTITNEERHEVAARLRDFDGFGYPSWKDLCNLIADFIEPEPERTCHMVQTIGYDYQFGYAGTEYVTELSCGHKYVDSYGDEPNYCPWCGARVVEE